MFDIFYLLFIYISILLSLQPPPESKYEPLNRLTDRSVAEGRRLNSGIKKWAEEEEDGQKREEERGEDQEGYVERGGQSGGGDIKERSHGEVAHLKRCSRT